LGDAVNARRKLALAGLLLTLIGCVHVPQEAPQLSLELAGRIQAVKAAHLQSVRLYMAAKRADVDTFIAREWLAVFARNTFEAPAVQRVYEQACRSNSAADRLELFVGLGTRLQVQLNQKRTELMQPLDAFEAELVRSIEGAYNEMLAINATLTGLLRAHAETTQTQMDILQKLKVDDRLASAVTEADKLVAMLTADRDAFQRNKPKIDEILKALKGK